MQTTTYKLNVTPGGVPLTIHISQYDVGLRQYTFQPYTSVGEFTYVSGATVTLEATKPDGYAVIHECTYNQDGSITYTIQEQLAAKPGRVWSKVVIRDGADVLGTGAVLWIVDYAGVKDDAIISDSDISGLEGYVDQLKTLVGVPIAVTTAAGMTDHEKLYLYEGSETGYTAGNWYYWNGSAWTSGGEYGSGAVEVDPTLSIAGEAADAKATGDAVNELKSDISKVYVTDTASGAVAHFNDGADDIPVEDLRISIKSVQSGSGSPSPTNVRPITGWTGATVFVSGEDTSESTQYTISWQTEAGTVYSGTLDVTTGALTVDMAGIDLGTLTWTYSASRFYAELSDGKKPIINEVQDFACSIFSNANITAYANMENGTALYAPSTFSATRSLFVVRDDRYTVADTFKTAVSGQTLVYPLANPQTYTITPTEVKTIIGTNNIWANTGDTEVEYRADTSLYFDKAFDFVTPEMFGAKGDGVTDDSQAFQTMFNTIASDTLIILRSPRYLISTIPLTIPVGTEYIRISGIGRSEYTPTLVMPASANSTGMVINSPGIGLYNIGFTVEGTRQTTQTAIEFNASANSGNIDAVIDNCVFIRFGECVKGYGRNIKASNCLFSTSYIVFDIYDIDGLTTDIRGFELSNNRVHASDVFIRNNSTYASGFKNWYVHDNFIDNVGTVFVGQGGGIFMSSNYLDVEDKPGQAFVISGNPSGIQDVLSNNYIRGNFKTGAGPLTINGVSCNIIVKDNVFANFANGATITGKIILVGNTFYTVGNDSSQYAVTLQGGASGKVHLNTFYDCNQTVNNLSSSVTVADNY